MRLVTLHENDHDTDHDHPSPPKVLLLPALLIPLAAPTPQDWPSWRGPHHDGAQVDSASSLAPLLDKQAKGKQAPRWTAPLPGPGASTPAVVGASIFVSALDLRAADLVCLCFERESGKLRWSHTAAKGKGNTSDPRGGPQNSLASPSPAADDEFVIFAFGSGDLLAFDHAGELLWRKQLGEEFGKLEIGFGYASSPLLLEGRLFVQLLHRPNAHLICLDPRTGRELWRVERATKAKKESREAYSSPLPFRNGQGTEILVLGGDALSAHEPATGRETWRYDKLNPRRRKNHPAISSVVCGDDGLVFIATAQHEPLRAIRVRGREVRELWSFEKPVPGITTPLFYRARLYALDGRNARLACLDPETGKPFWIEDLELPSVTFASPTAGDGKLFFIDTSGVTLTLAAGDTFQPLGRGRLDSQDCRASIVPLGETVLVRTGDRLYAF